jgi:hypothetical protein
MGRETLAGLPCPGYEIKLQPRRLVALMALAVDGPLNNQQATIVSIG